MRWQPWAWRPRAFSSNESPAAAADDVLTVTIYVAGDPTSTVAYGVGTLGDAPSARMSYYSTDGDLNQFSPGVTPSRTRVYLR